MAECIIQESANYAVFDAYSEGSDDSQGRSEITCSALINREYNDGAVN